MAQKLPPAMLLQPNVPLFHVRAFEAELHVARAAPKKFVVEAVVVKRFVVVALVAVAFPNICPPVQVLAFARLRPIV